MSYCTWYNNLHCTNHCSGIKNRRVQRNPTPDPLTDQARAPQSTIPRIHLRARRDRPTLESSTRVPVELSTSHQSVGQFRKPAFETYVSMMYDVASDMIIAYRGEYYLYYKVLPGYPLTIKSSVCVISLKYRIILFTDSFFAIVCLCVFAYYG